MKNLSEKKVKKVSYCKLTLFLCAKHRHLIINITERVGKILEKFSADSAFSFSGIGPKTKTRNWREVFKTCRIPI